MSKELNRLQDIQYNPTEFNIKYHMGAVIAIAIMNTLLSPYNKKVIEDLLHDGIKSPDIHAILISRAFEPLITEYLSASAGIDEDDLELMGVNN